MTSLFNHAVKQSQAIKKDLDKFAEAPELAPVSLQGQISASLTSFSRTIDDYERAVSNEIEPDKQEKGRVRIEKFKAELQDAKEQYKRLREQREETMHAESRQELFARRVPHGATSSENPYSQQPEYTDMSREEGIHHENDVLGRVGMQLDQFIEQGQAALEDLGQQSQVLRNARQSMVNVATTLGVSSDTIRMVERRAFQDKWLFYGGAIFMFVCFYFIIRWLR